MALIESGKERLARYSAALSERTQIIDKLEAAYRFTNPQRNVFFDKTKSEQRSQDVFDSTPVEALNSFANNLQFVLMPPGRQWATLVSGDEIPEDSRQQVDEALQVENDILFTHLNFSNLNQVANESFKDMGISTGVILIQETPEEDIPFTFVSVPPSDVAFEQNSRGQLENFWRCLKMKGREVKRQWPAAQLPSSLEQTITKNPNQPIELIEGTIVYPLSPPSEQIYYYVQTKEGVDIFTEFKDYNPWIGFRFSKSPIDVWGTGPGLSMLRTISMLNKMVQLELGSYELRANPIYLARSDAIFNASNFRLTPGSIVPVSDMGGVAPLQSGGDPSFSQLNISEARLQIKEAFLSDPLSPTPTPNQSATEIAIRQNNWIRRSTSSFGRLTNELLAPIIEKSLAVLRKAGKISSPIEVNNRTIKIKYQSPVAELQGREELQRFQEWSASISQFIPPEGMVGIVNMDKLPFWMGEKIGIDLTLLKTPEETTEIIEKAIEQQKEAVEQSIEVAQDLSNGSPEQVANTGVIS